MIKIIIFAIAFGMLLGFGGWKLTPVPKIEIPVRQKFAYDFSKPPSETIIGKVASISGAVFYKKRVGEDILPLDKDFIYQGENLFASDSGKIIIDFSGTLLSIEPKTEVDIIQTLPDKFVFNQLSGVANYTFCSVRVGHVLVEVTDTTTKIEMIKNLTKITGSGKISYNDAYYNSKMLDLVNGKTVTFNDTLREVVK